MQSVFSVFQKLEATPGKIDKLNILKSNEDNTELQKMLKLALDPYQKFHIAKLPKIDPQRGESLVTIEMFEQLTTKLRKRELTGHAARDAVAEFFSFCDEGDQLWFGRVLTKNLRAGVDTTVDKVWPDLIPGFEVQRAEAYKPEKPKTRAKIDAIIKRCGYIYSSRKLDGMRCVYIRGVLYSRGGHEIDTVPHISQRLQELFGDQYVFDGELWFPSDEGFEDFISIVKRSSPHADSTSVLLNVFDCMLVEEWEAQKCTRPLSERLAMLEATIGQAKDSIAVVVDHEVARTFEDVEQLYESYLEDGFEGSMLKDPDGGYVFKKSWDWIKVKPEEDAEYLCIGLQEGRPDTRWVGTTGALILKTADGKEFNCAGMKASRRDQFWNNPDTVLDKWITVKYQNLTKNGIPRFPEYKAVRDYE